VVPIEAPTAPAEAAVEVVPVVEPEPVAATPAEPVRVEQDTVAPAPAAPPMVPEAAAAEPVIGPAIMPKSVEDVAAAAPRRGGWWKR